MPPRLQGPLRPYVRALCGFCCANANVGAGPFSPPPGGDRFVSLERRSQQQQRQDWPVARLLTLPFVQPIEERINSSLRPSSITEAAGSARSVRATSDPQHPFPTGNAGSTSAGKRPRGLTMTEAAASNTSPRHRRSSLSQTASPLPATTALDEEAAARARKIFFIQRSPPGEDRFY